MKRIKAILFLTIFCLSFIRSQDKFEIRLVLTNNIEIPNVLCFDTQFKNISSSDIQLEGQNYRLFYDALQLKYLKQKGIRSYLPRVTYEQIDLNQTLHNIDARGYGSLQFSQNLGFINYSLRMKENKIKVIKLPSHSGWLSTSNICFQATNPLGPINLIWARKGLTDGYATAFTEISVLDKDGIGKPALIQVYQDFIRLSDGTGINDPMVLQSTQND